MDRIEKQLVVRAPRPRVFAALTEGTAFGTWFGARVPPGPFRPGAHVTGTITTPGYEGWPLDMLIEAVEPESFFSYRWHPYADPALELEDEPRTLVEVRLDEVPGGTLIRVTESGFERIPPPRRARVLEMNSAGWVAQLDNVRRHVEER